MEDGIVKVVIESKIPFIRGVLEPVADVEYVAPNDITASTVAGADVLIVRTRTRCDAALLEGSSVKWIGTATIGTDHIDADYCKLRGIKVVNAPGCNAPAVAQYVSAALKSLIPGGFERKKIGVVGVGHVGRIVAEWAGNVGMDVLKCDPPRARVEGCAEFVSLAQIAADCDVITFHLPLTTVGTDATFHLVGSQLYAQCRRAPIIINAARGAVLDTQSTVDAIDSGLISGAVIDCWEGEPNVNRSLLQRATIATPHIAGYSLQGKQRATMMIVREFAREFGFDADLLSGLPFEITPAIDSTVVSTNFADYDIMADDRAFRAAPHLFESLRNNYNYRSEY